MKTEINYGIPNNWYDISSFEIKPLLKEGAIILNGIAIYENYLEFTFSYKGGSLGQIRWTGQYSDIPSFIWNIIEVEKKFEYSFDVLEKLYD